MRERCPLFTRHTQRLERPAGENGASCVRSPQFLDSTCGVSVSKKSPYLTEGKGGGYRYMSMVRLVVTMGGGGGDNRDICFKQ
jgi:hypothetical protein